MQSRLYFAYGSNMLTTRLAARCPSVLCKGIAYTDGWHVQFTKPGGDGSGKAGLAQAPSARHPGILYQIHSKEIDTLDRIEGVGHGYTRHDGFPVTTVAGEAVSSFTYMPTRHDQSLLPYDWYLALCVAGAMEHGLDAHLLEGFARHPHLPDTQAQREARTLAVQALNAAGHQDWLALLR